MDSCYKSFFDHQSLKYFIKKFLKNKNIYDSAFTADSIKSFIYNLDKSKWISHNSKKKSGSEHKI